MGILTNWLAKSSGIETDKALHAMSNQFTPGSIVNWTSSAPKVVAKIPKSTTTNQADKAEREAALLKISVSNTKRLLRAETEKQKANAELVVSHRNYLGKTASAHFKGSKANAQLASKLEKLRASYAGVAMALERDKQVTEQTIDVTAVKYNLSA
jgi:hypothetical protein